MLLLNISFELSHNNNLQTFCFFFILKIWTLSSVMNIWNMTKTTPAFKSYAKPNKTFALFNFIPRSLQETLDN